MKKTITIKKVRGVKMKEKFDAKIVVKGKIVKGDKFFCNPGPYSYERSAYQMSFHSILMRVKEMTLSSVKAHGVTAVQNVSIKFKVNTAPAWRKRKSVRPVILPAYAKK